MNILEIIVIVVTAALIFWGWHQGFVKKLASMLMLVLSIVLVSVVLPYVTGFLKNNTPLYDNIYERCDQVVSDQIDTLLASLSDTIGTYQTGSGSGTSGTTEDGGTGSGASGTTADDGTASELDRDEIKSLMEQYGYGDYTSLIDALTDEELEQYVDQYLNGDFSSLFTTGSTGNVEMVLTSVTLDGSGAGQTAMTGFHLLSAESDSALEADASGSASDASSSTLQTEIINALPIPQVIKNMLINHNNEESYESLDVSTFQEYLVGSISTLLLNAISFLVAVILVNVALRVAFMLLNIFANLPVIGLANRLAGAALGLVEALFLLWLFFLILTVAQTSDMGSSIMTTINNSPLLSWLYESNLFLRIVTWAAARLM